MTSEVKMVAREWLCPGVAVAGGRLQFCPRCGMEPFGTDPGDPGEVREWLEAAFCALRDCLGIDPPEEWIEEIVIAWKERPWHV